MKKIEYKRELTSNLENRGLSSKLSFNRCLLDGEKIIEVDKN